MVRTKLIGILVVAIVLLLGALGVRNFQYKTEKAERKRTEGNQNALMSENKEYKGKDSLNTIKIETLVLSKNELKEYQSELVASIEAKDIKIKRLKSATIVKTKTKIDVKAEMTDSIIYVHTSDTSYIDTMKCISYKDAFFQSQTCKIDSSWRTLVDMNAEFDFIAFGIPRRFLFIPFGTKEIELIVSTDNPYVHFEKVQRIEIKKRRNKRN